MVDQRKKLFEGKVAIVTGGGRGIGRSEALLYAAEGASVLVNDLGGPSTGGGRDPSIAQLVVDEIRRRGGRAEANGSDAGSWNGAAAIVEAAMDAFGRIDIVSNNAGIARPVRIDEVSETDWDLVLAVNLKGYASLIRHAAAHIIRQREGGVIINKSSPSGFGHYSNSAYSAAKEGVVGLTRSVARDLGEFGIRCNAVRPVAKGSQMATEEMANTLRRAIDLGFPFLWNRPQGFVSSTVTPEFEHVAALTAWLSSDETHNVNGREFYIDGATAGIFPEPELGRTMTESGGWTIEAFLKPGVHEYLVGDARNRYSGHFACPSQ